MTASTLMAAAAEPRTARLRSLRRSAAAGTLSHGITLAVALATVPVALDGLGAERFGAWMAIASLVTVLGAADLGIGAGLVNVIVAAEAASDREAVRRAVSTAAVVLTALAAALALAFAVLHGAVDWAGIVGVHSDPARDEVGLAVIAAAASVLVGLPLTLVERIRAGRQQGHVTSTCAAVGAVVALAFVGTAVAADAPLAAVVGAGTCGPVLARVLNLALFVSAMPDRRWRRPGVDADMLRRLVHAGGLYFVLQLAIVVAFNSDQVVIARVLGAETAAVYAVPFKLFNAVAVGLGLALMPLWPAYADALVRRDYAWVRRTLRASIAGTTAVAGAAGAALLVFGPTVMGLWAPGIDVPTGLLWSLAAWLVLGGVGGAVAMFLNGAGVVRFQIAVATAMAVANVGLSFDLAGRLGVEGPITATILTYGVLVLVPYAWFVPRHLRHLETT